MIALLGQCTGSRLIPTGTRELFFSAVTAHRGKPQQGCWIFVAANADAVCAKQH